MFPGFVVASPDFELNASDKEPSSTKAFKRTSLDSTDFSKQLINN